jgi:xanthine dehydrogenase accessory factor
MIRSELAQQVEALTAECAPFVEATVVRAQSPTSVRPGDTAIVRGDGTIEGFVGGTCAEASVRLHALRALETDEPVLLRLLAADAPESTPAVEGAVTVKNPCLSGGALEIFLEPHLPAARIRVVGRSPIGFALAELSKRLGYAVEVNAAEESDPGADDAAVVVASHGHDEARVLSAALGRGVPYVALVASRVRGDAVRESLDLPGELRARLRTPAGLDIGAQTPAEIALAILAEIVALRPHERARGSGPHAVVAPRPADHPPTDRVHSDADANVTAVGVAVDPVCGMEVAASPATLQLQVNGERYYFCGDGCRDSFAAEHAPDGIAR